MSRIGKLPVLLPSGVTARLSDNLLIIKGQKAELSLVIHPSVSVKIDGSNILVIPGNTEDSPAMFGTTRALIANMVHGVTSGFEKVLEIVGVGYKVQQDGKNLKMWLGFSHNVSVVPIDGVIIKADGENKIIVSGFDKQKVGLQAARIRELKKPEPYKGKGIRYIGINSERIVIKQGKKVAKK